MDISYRRQLPKPLLMYFAYNDNSLGDSRKAYVYASVITYKDNDPQTYGNYKETMERFAQRKAADGQIDENARCTLSGISSWTKAKRRC